MAKKGIATKQMESKVRTLVERLHTYNGVAVPPENYRWGIPSTNRMTIAHATTPFGAIYKRSGDTFTKLANSAGGGESGE